LDASGKSAGERADHRIHNARARSAEFQELLARDCKNVRITQRHDSCRARQAREKAHLADRLALSNFGDRLRHAPDMYAEPAGTDEVESIGGLTLSDENIAPSKLLLFGCLRQRFEIAERRCVATQHARQNVSRPGR
jgi:hypothetical protein